MKTLNIKAHKNIIQTFVMKISIVTLVISMLSACSTHQQLFLDSPANADENFRLTRPVSYKLVNTADSESNKKVTPPILLMSTGDKIRIQVENGQEFSGIFTIDVDGYIKIPYLKPVYANGSTPNALTESIKQSLNFTLTINNQITQEGNINLMMYKPDEILSELQTFMTLNDGDIVMTGTPKGVGVINKGDVFEAKIFEQEKLLVGSQWIAT